MNFKDYGKDFVYERKCDFGFFKAKAYDCKERFLQFKTFKVVIEVETIDIVKNVKMGCCLNS